MTYNDQTSPTMSSFEELLSEGIEQSLRAHLSDNAIFLAERLCVAHPSANASNLLARAHLQAGNLSRAATALHPPTTQENRYLYALCCFKIGTPQRLRDAEEQLRVANTRDIAGGAAGHYLLAAIYHRTARKEAAVEHYQRALRANPTLWLAFDGLSKLGLGPGKVDAVFANASDANARALLRNEPFASATPVLPTPQTPEISFSHPPLPSPRRRLRGLHSGLRVTQAAVPVRVDNVAPETPTNDGFVTPSPVPVGTRVEFVDTSHRPHAVRRAPRTTSAPTGVHELQAKLFATPNANNTETPRKRATPRRKALPPREEEPTQAPPMLTLEVMHVLRALAKASAATRRYQCALALKLVDELPTPHDASAFAHSLRARAHLESGRFSAACAAFSRALEADPTCVATVAAEYSTALWHVKDAVSLAALTARAGAETPAYAGAYVAAGNAASLLRDGAGALRHFRRAVKISPRDAYAHALVGTELAAAERFDDALRAFRDALDADERCYRALYGIAQVLHKQEQFVLCEQHYRAALVIHPRSALLRYHLALALAARAARAQPSSSTTDATALGPALEQLESACKLDPANPVAAFERAKMLAAVGRSKDAHLALLKLRDAMPREAEVHYELARIERQLGDHHAAMRSIVLALSFDPKERKYKKEQEALNIATTQLIVEG